MAPNIFSHRSTMSNMIYGFAIVCEGSSSFLPLSPRNQFRFLSILILVSILFPITDLAESLRRGNLLVPQTYSPMNGDLNVQLQYFTQQPKKSATFNSDESASLSSEEDDFLKTTSAPKQSKTLTDDVRLQISQFNGTNRTTVGILDVYPDSRLNTTQITISCLNFLFGGMYELEIVGGNDIDEGANTLDNHDERLRQQLDVRWPQPKLSVTPESIGTYPQQPVDVILEFPGVECIVPHTQLDKVPEFWLELYFCGHEVYCDSANVSSSQVLYAEQIRGYPKARLVKLSCELFGLAGHYVVKLRPIMPVAASVSATAYIQVNPNRFHYLFFQFPLCIAYGLFRFHFRRLSFFCPDRRHIKRIINVRECNLNAKTIISIHRFAVQHVCTCAVFLFLIHILDTFPGYYLG